MSIPSASENIAAMQKDEELQLKKRDQTLKEYEALGKYYEETRTLALALTKLILLVSGSSLTISIGLFLKDDAPSLTPPLLYLLQWAWKLLFLSMIAAMSTVFIAVVLMRNTGKNWKESLDTHKKLDHKTTSMVVIGWVIGISAFICCVSGLALQACIAVQLLD